MKSLLLCSSLSQSDQKLELSDWTIADKQSYCMMSAYLNNVLLPLYDVSVENFKPCVLQKTFDIRKCRSATNSDTPKLYNKEQEVDKTIRCKTGVRQGCMLGPRLLNRLTNWT